MKELKEELKALLIKYNAVIFVDQVENDSILNLQLIIGDQVEIIDTGYRDLVISKYNL